MNIDIRKKIQRVRVQLTIFFFLFFVSCNEYKIVDLTKNTHLTRIIEENETTKMSISANEIWLYEVDKNRSVFISPDEVVLGLSLKFTNLSNQPKSLTIAMGKSDIKGEFNYKGYSDSLSFFSFRTEQAQTVLPSESRSFSVVSELYDFEGLFSEKMNYTKDMIELLSNLELYAFADGERVPISFSEDVRVYAKSTKR